VRGYVDAHIIDVACLHIAVERTNERVTLTSDAEQQLSRVSSRPAAAIEEVSHERSHS
jgi:hypothetical protein